MAHNGVSVSAGTVATTSVSASVSVRAVRNLHVSRTDCHDFILPANNPKQWASVHCDFIFVLFK